MQFSLFFSLPIFAGVVFTALPRQLFWTTAGSPVYLYWYQYQSYPRSERSSRSNSIKQTVSNYSKKPLIDWVSRLNVIRSQYSFHIFSRIKSDLFKKGARPTSPLRTTAYLSGSQPRGCRHNLIYRCDARDNPI